MMSVNRSYTTYIVMSFYWAHRLISVNYYKTYFTTAIGCITKSKVAWYKIVKLFYTSCTLV